MTDLERYLITKFKIRQDNRVDLWPKGMKHPELILFDETDLHEAGVNWREFERGIEHPCRFWAHWAYSDKTKSTGANYKDVVRLEPVPYAGRQDTCEAPNPAPQTGATAIIDRLDAMLGELQAIQQLIAALINDVRELITSTNGHHSTANGTPIEEITKWWQIDDPFPSPEAAIDWAMQRGIFKARQHAQNAYEKAKRDGQPKTANQMAPLWRAEIKRRTEAQPEPID